MRKHTTRRTFLAGLAAAASGCSVASNTDSPTETPTDEPPKAAITTLSADETAAYGGFAYRPETAVVYDSIPTEWVVDLPESYRSGDTPDRLQPAAGWRLCAVRMRVENVSESANTPPYPSTAFGVYDMDASETWDADPDVTLRAPDYDAFNSNIHTAAAVPGDVPHLLYSTTQQQPIAPGETTTGGYVAEVPAAPNPDAFRPTLGHTATDGTQDAAYTHRWTLRAALREPPTEQTTLQR
jgi:hypothetical protein